METIELARLYHEAEALYESGLYRKAAPLYSQLAEANPDDSELERRCGICLARLGKKRQARAALADLSGFRMAVIDVIPDVFIRSYVSRGGINMGLMMLSYVLGSIAFGWYGVFLGPIVLVLALHFATDVLPGLVEGRSIRVTTD